MLTDCVNFFNACINALTTHIVGGLHRKGE